MKPSAALLRWVQQREQSTCARVRGLALGPERGVHLLWLARGGAALLLSAEL